MSDTGERDFAKIASIASILIGFLSLLCAFVPACGVITVLFGMGAGGFAIAKAQTPRERLIGGIGLALCLVGMLLSCGNGYIGFKIQTDPNWNPYGIRDLMHPDETHGPSEPVPTEPAPQLVPPPPTPPEPPPVG